MKLLFSIFVLVLLASCNRHQQDVVIPSKSYREILADIAKNKTQFSEEYQKANLEEQKVVIEKAREFILEQLVTEIFPSWHGTKWDFNGTTQTPQEGYIACGYFVTTTLRDVGFNIPRVKWAQMASEKMITSATVAVTRFSGKKIEVIETWLLSEPDGLYIVGLDNHTGFVLKSGNHLRFIHSSPASSNGGVDNESVTSHNPLSVSGYRVFGRLLSDKMMKRWLTNFVY